MCLSQKSIITISVVDPDPYSGASWIRIRIRNKYPDPHMQILDKMEATKDVRFKIFISNLETQFLYVTVCAHSFKKIYTVLVLKKIIFL